ncbi:MAG: carbohydrate ABC transporter permease [Bacilli bacterium]|nr:carbohydrate ABC transporter permease [Bacilli bacterium]
MKTKLHRDERIRVIVFSILLVVTALLSMFPFYWMILNSFKNPSIIFKVPTDFFTFNLTWDSFAAVFKYENGIIWRAYANSLFIAVTSTIGTLFTSSLAAFAFAKLKFRGNKLIYSIFIATLMIPGQVTLLPLYVIFAKIGWVNTFLPLIIPGCLINTYGVFMLRSFIVSIPDDLIAASKVDGCGTLRQYFHVILPLCKPALITLGLFSFIGSWNNYFGQFIYLSSEDLTTIPLLIASLKESNMTGVEWGRVMAASTLSVIPFAVVYLFCQKYFVQGIATTGLK